MRIAVVINEQNGLRVLTYMPLTTCAIALPTATLLCLYLSCIDGNVFAMTTQVAFVNSRTVTCLED